MCTSFCNIGLHSMFEFFSQLEIHRLVMTKDKVLVQIKRLFTSDFNVVIKLFILVIIATNKLANTIFLGLPVKYFIVKCVNSQETFLIAKLIGTD